MHPSDAYLPSIRRSDDLLHDGRSRPCNTQAQAMACKPWMAISYLINSDTLGGIADLTSATLDSGSQMAFLASNLTTPVGGNVSQNYFFRDPWSSSPAFAVADEAPNGAAPGGGSNYNKALPNGAPITVNIQETPAVSGKCTATQTTTVKAGTGELTQTQSISCQASASVAGINAIFSNIGNAM